MFNNILVPLDGSHLAEAALPVAMELASRFDSEITLMRVTRPPYVATSVGGSAYAEMLVEMREQLQSEANHYLRRLQATLRQQGHRVHTYVVEGDSAAERILEASLRFDINVIVMSTHGRSGISRWVFGSVADRVLQRSHVPVLLIRAHDEQLHWTKSVEQMHA